MKSQTRIRAAILPLTLVAAIVQGEQSADTARTSPSSDWIVLPIVYYTPETKLALAVGGLYFFRDGTDATTSHPSAIAATIEYTQLGQMQFELQPDIVLWEGEYRVTGQLGYRKFPAVYYGSVKNPGREDRYTPQTFYGRMNLQRTIYPHTTAGGTLTYANQRMVHLEEGGVLASGQILGSHGGSTMGVGATLTYDDRDNTFFPSSGRYYDVSYATFQQAFGSDYTFSQWKADLRDYYPVGRTHVIALQKYMSIVTGDAPFQYLSTVGGKDILRGYPEGYYRDKTMIALQLDYRVTPLWWRVGLAAFAGVGEVAERPDRMRIADMKWSAGFGVRYLLIEEEKLSLRVDYAWGTGTSGMYITINEAF